MLFEMQAEEIYLRPENHIKLMTSFQFYSAKLKNVNKFK